MQEILLVSDGNDQQGIFERELKAVGLSDRS
jgi:hypothetical protein